MSARCCEMARRLPSPFRLVWCEKRLEQRPPLGREPWPCSPVHRDPVSPGTTRSTNSPLVPRFHGAIRCESLTSPVETARLRYHFPRLRAVQCNRHADVLSLVSTEQGVAAHLAASGGEGGGVVRAKVLVPHESGPRRRAGVSSGFACRCRARSMNLAACPRGWYAASGWSVGVMPGPSGKHASLPAWWAASCSRADLSARLSRRPAAEQGVPG